MMKRGSYIVNTARGKICDRDAIVRALESGQLAGYAGDVWFPQPAPKDHPWRTMPHHGMTPHISGSSLSAQARYAAGTREILESYFAKKPIRTEYLIVDKGKLAGAGAHPIPPATPPKAPRRRRSSRSPRPRHRIAVPRIIARGRRRFSPSGSVLLRRALARDLLMRRLLGGGLLLAGWSGPCHPAACRPGLSSSRRHQPAPPRTHGETFLMLRDMQARSALVPSPYSLQ